MKSLLIVALIGASAVMAGDEVRLWNGNMSGIGTETPEGVVLDKGRGAYRVAHVSDPSLTLFLLKKATAPVPMIIVCPGGGYNMLSWTKEGTEVAEWLNSIGVSAAVLKYRVPKNRSGALDDAKQAVRLARKNSKDWNIHPDKVGMLGFSAGGHLTAACSTSSERPDFAILVYPAYLFKKGGVKLVDAIEVDAETPPTFIVQTKDDKKYYRSTLAYSVALDAVGVDVESHLFAKGGHGYGLRDTGHPVNQWPQLCEAWMRDVGILK